MKSLKQTQEEELKKFDKEFVDNLGWADKHVYRDGGRIHIERVKQFLLSAMEASAQGAIREVIEAIESTEIKATCPRSDVDLIKEVEILNEVIKKNIMPEIISQLKQRWLGEKI